MLSPGSLFSSNHFATIKHCTCTSRETARHAQIHCPSQSQHGAFMNLTRFPCAHCIEKTSVLRPRVDSQHLGYSATRSTHGRTCRLLARPATADCTILPQPAPLPSGGALHRDMGLSKCVHLSTFQAHIIQAITDENILKTPPRTPSKLQTAEEHLLLEALCLFCIEKQ